MLVNSVVYSKLWYVATTHYLTADFFVWLDRLVFSFIWKRKEKVERPSLSNPFEEGGLYSVHAEYSNIALVITKHIYNLLLGPRKPWSSLARYWLALPLRKYSADLWSNSMLHSDQTSLFYMEALKAFTKAVDNCAIINCTNNSNISKYKYGILVPTITVEPRIYIHEDNEVVQLIWRRINILPLSPEPRDVA